MADESEQIYTENKSSNQSNVTTTSSLFASMHSLAFVQLDPAGDNSKVSFICTYKLKLIAKPWEALGMSIQGFSAQKEEKRKGEEGGRDGKNQYF